LSTASLPPQLPINRIKVKGDNYRLTGVLPERAEWAGADRQLLDLVGFQCHPKLFPIA
jgi:hypothetical protein